MNIINLLAGLFLSFCPYPGGTGIIMGWRAWGDFGHSCGVVRMNGMWELWCKWVIGMDFNQRRGWEEYPG